MSQINIALLVLSLLFSNVSNAADITDKKSINIWIFSSLTSKVVRSKLGPFADLLESKTGYEVHLYSSSDELDVINTCKEYKYSILSSSLPITKKIFKECNYKLAAVSFQEVHLFIRKNNDDIASVERVGVIDGYEATLIAREELNDQKVEFYEYEDFFELIKNIKKDGIDAIAIHKGAFKESYSFTKNWKSIHKFNQPGIGTFYISPELPIEVQHIVSDTLLENGVLITKLFQEEAGLGPFVSPEILLNKGQQNDLR